MPRFACNPVLTYKGGVRCNMFAGALVPRRGTTAGVPGPRRSADECDAGWFAPVATRRRSLFFWAARIANKKDYVAVRAAPTALLGLAELGDRDHRHPQSHDRHHAE